MGPQMQQRISIPIVVEKGVKVLLRKVHDTTDESYVGAMKQRLTGILRRKLCGELERRVFGYNKE